MLRKIVDYSKLNTEVLNLLVEKYPDGYGDNDIIVFRNAKNEIVEAVEIKTDDIIYLVKVGQRLVQAMEDHADDDDDDDDIENDNKEKLTSDESIESLEEEEEEED